MKFAHRLARCVLPTAFFSPTTPVFAGNVSTPRQHLGKKFVKSALHFVAHGGVAIVAVGHDVDMNVTVTGMPKAGDGKAVLRVQPLREFNKIDNAAAGDDHILVQFG